MHTHTLTHACTPVHTLTHMHTCTHRSVVPFCHQGGPDPWAFSCWRHDLLCMAPGVGEVVRLPSHAPLSGLCLVCETDRSHPTSPSAPFPVPPGLCCRMQHRQWRAGVCRESPQLPALHPGPLSVSGQKEGGCQTAGRQMRARAPALRSFHGQACLALHPVFSPVLVRFSEHSRGRLCTLPPCRHTSQPS